MKRLFAVILALFIISTQSMAVERKPLHEVDADSMTSDTQVTLQGAGDSHVALAWWMPNEFWASILARDISTSDADKQSMLDAMSGTSLLAVVQADITSLGAFKFYAKDEIEKSMSISVSDPSNKQMGLEPMKRISPDLEVVLGVFKPILGAAMGNLGSNMHFYVLNDRASDAARLLDPYQQKKIEIQLKKRDNTQMNASIEMPLNSLFVPRTCPNGKEAHISWKFFPWSGEPL